MSRCRLLVANHVALLEKWHVALMWREVMNCSSEKSLSWCFNGDRSKLAHVPRLELLRLSASFRWGDRELVSHLNFTNPYCTIAFFRPWRLLTTAAILWYVRHWWMQRTCVMLYKQRFSATWDVLGLRRNRGKSTTYALKRRTRDLSCKDRHLYPFLNILLSHWWQFQFAYLTRLSIHKPTATLV